MEDKIKPFLDFFGAHPYFYGMLGLVILGIYIYYRGIDFTLFKWHIYIPDKADRLRYEKLSKEIEHYQKPTYLAESRTGLTSFYIPDEPEAHIRGFVDDITHVEGLRELRKRINEVDSLGIELLENMSSTLQGIIESRLQSGREFRIYSKEEMEPLLVTKFCRYPNLVVNGRRYDAQGHTIIPALPKEPVSGTAETKAG